MFLNWFIPAFVNISVGSSLITIGAEGTILCPLDAKKSKNDWRICLEVIMLYILFDIYYLTVTELVEVPDYLYFYNKVQR
jgi:hypothetical protein